MQNKTSENKQNVTQQKSVANSIAAGGISLPAVGVLKKKEGKEERLQMKSNSPIQLYSYGPEETQEITVTGASEEVTFTVGSKNTVSFDKGDNMDHFGSDTQRPAEWKGWIDDQGTGNAATQMHLVNAEWGGEGRRGDPNIAPGSQNLNHNHLTDAEDVFRKEFEADEDADEGYAPQELTYTCEFEYENTEIDLTEEEDGEYEMDDPEITVTIDREDGTSDDLDVTPGNGIRFIDGSEDEGEAAEED